MPVIPAPYRIEHDPEDNRLELYCGTKKVEFGVIWHGYGCQIDGKTGRILAITEKAPKVRAVFGSNHLDYTL